LRFFRFEKLFQLIKNILTVSSIQTWELFPAKNALKSVGHKNKSSLFIFEILRELSSVSDMSDDNPRKKAIELLKMSSAAMVDSYQR
jgi:hypothetical protein